MRVSSATEEVIAAINNERRRQSAVLEPIANSQNQPKYSLTVTLVIGSVILVCMFTGVYLAVRFGY